MKKTTGCLNSKYPHFPKVDIDMMLITEENKSTEFLQEFISKKVSSWNLDRHEKECFLNWILAKSVGGKSLLHCGKFFPMDSAYEIGYVMTYLLLDINHEIIFYSNQTDILQLISTYKNKRSSRPGRYSKGLIKLWSVEIYSLTSLFCYLERFLFLLLLLQQMFPIVQ